MRLVIDRNLWLSGLLWDGTPARLLDAALTGQAEVFTSPRLLDELQTVLKSPKFAHRLASCGQTPASVVARVRRCCCITEPAAIAPPTELRNPADVIVLACAVSAGADMIVTGDRDLLVLRSFRRIPILTATAALHRLKHK